MMIDIKRFVGHGDVRSYITEPFVCLGGLAATNGHIMVFLPQIPADYDNAPQCHTRMIDSVGKIISSAKSASYWPMPAYEVPESKTCHDCEGGGHAIVTLCEECAGVGDVYMMTNHNEYECVCKTCDGSGRETKQTTDASHTCPKCVGLGKEWHWNQYVLIEGRAVFGKYAAILKEIEGIEVAPDFSDKSDALHCRQVKSGEVTAYITVMPIRA